MEFMDIKQNPVALKNMNMHNSNLSEYACKDSECVRLKPASTDIRTSFFRDIDRVIYTLAYTRYIDKTQVFTGEENDMISKRIIHVQLVSRIARTIGRALNLNEDLIEAAAIGHDLGHTPFGHVGESILNEISMRYGEGYFNHNVQSVRLLNNVENKGRGSNLSVQVLDAIFCHNGEMVNCRYSPCNKTVEEFLNEYEKSYVDKDVLKNARPMTLEGCVVRISDVIAYIGKDIEDAIRLNVIKKSDLPEEAVKVLGRKNSQIINTIVNDIIENSVDKNYIEMSPKVYDALMTLMKFNYDYIYSKANTKEELDNYKMMFNDLCDFYLNELKKDNKNCDIYTEFLKYMCDDYMNNTTDERKVIDFVSGMTDDYFFIEYNKYCKENIK